MEKATRESKQQTNWTQQNNEFEDALRTFIERILDSHAFASELEDFVGRVLHAGRLNSLAQTLVKYTAPGVPDTYQGSELWDLSLVDPDNRRPVDYDLRRTMLADLQAGMNVEEIMDRMESGLPKLFIAQTALRLRRDHPEWFGAEAAYAPLLAEGSKSDHLVGYLRGDSVAVLVPRWPLKLGGSWASTTVRLPPGRWVNLFTREEAMGGPARVQALLQRFPVALLAREAE